MADKQEVRCTRRCYDSKIKRRYFPGDIDNVDPENPIAQYFEGWAPGTKVYVKERGSKTKEVKETTRTIPEGAAPLKSAIDGGKKKSSTEIEANKKLEEANKKLEEANKKLEEANEKLANAAEPPAPPAAEPPATPPAPPAAEPPAPPAAASADEGEMCPHCGKGPFKNLGAHLNHCTMVPK